MKSSFLEKSKRALVLLLTGAMIATSVPSNAFAATVDADDDVIIEEAVDAVADEAIVEEEVVATDEPSDVVEALGADTVEADDAETTVRTITVDTTGLAGSDALVYNTGFLDLSAEANENWGATPYKDVTWTLMAIDEDDAGTAYVPVTYSAKTPETTNPKTEGLYELISGDYVLTEDTTVESKTYYEKIAAVPATGFYALVDAYDTAQEDFRTLQNDANKKALTDARKAITDTIYAVATDPSTANVNGAKKESTGEYVFTGPKPTKVYDGWFVLVATDTDGTTAGNVGYSYPFEIKVSRAPIDAGSTAGADDIYDHATPTTVNTVAFTTAQDGYGVYASATDATKAGATNYTLAETIHLSTSLTDAISLPASAYSITDRAGASGKVLDYFTVTASRTSLDSTHPIELTVTPKAGLTSIDGTHTYVAYLHISHEDGLKDDIVIGLSLTIAQNIAVSITADGETLDPEDAANYATVTLANGDSKYGFYTTAGDESTLITNPAAVSSGASTVYARELGEFVIGEDVGTIVVSATSAGADELELLNDIVMPSGLTINSVKGNPATYTITGAVAQSKAKTYVFGLNAKDKNTGNNMYVKYALTATAVEGYDADNEIPGLDITIGGKSYDHGETYEWYTAKSDDDKAIEATITNRTGTALTFTPSFNSISKLAIAPGVDEITLAAGASKTYTITPATTKGGTDSASGSFGITADSNNGIAVQTVSLSYTRLGSDIKVTSPKANIATDNELTDAVIGLDYDGFDVEVATDSGYTIVAYEVVGGYVPVANPKDADIANYYERQTDGTFADSADGSVTDGKTYYVEKDPEYVAIPTAKLADGQKTHYFTKTGSTYTAVGGSDTLDPTGATTYYAQDLYWFTQGDDYELTGGTTPRAADVVNEKLTSAEVLSGSYGITLNKSTGKFASGANGVLNGGAADLAVLIRVTLYKGTNPLYVYRYATLDVDDADVADAIAITYKGASLNSSTANSFKMDDTGMGNIEAPSADVDLKNEMIKVDITNETTEGIIPTITKVEWTDTAATPTTTTWTRGGHAGADNVIIDGLFEIGYPTGANSTNGIGIAAGKTSKFAIAAKNAPAGNPSNTDPTDNSVGGKYFLAPGTWEITIDIDSTSLANSHEIVAKLNVKDAPVIDTTEIDKFLNVMDVNAPLIVYGTPVQAVTVSGTDYNPIFVATASDGTGAGNYKFRWAKNADSELDIADSGLTLNEEGKIENVDANKGPILAGTYIVDVTASLKDDETVRTTIPYVLTVQGSTEISVGLDPANATDPGTDPSPVGGKLQTYVMTGVKAGDGAQLQIKLVNGPDAVAEDVTITLANAEDDRDTSLAATTPTGKDIAANPDNPYDVNDSKSKFVADANNFTLAKGGQKIVNLDVAKTVDPGEYKVKVTIGGKNVTETSFYAYLAVVPALELGEELLSPNGTVGEAYSQDLKAKGGAKDQATTIAYALDSDWTAAGGALPVKVGGGNLALAGAVLDDNTGYNKDTITGTPAKAYDKDVKFDATIAAIQYKDKSIKADTTNYPVINNTANVYPAQKLDIDFHMNIGASNKVVIGKSYDNAASGVDGDAIEWSAPRSATFGTSMATTFVTTANANSEYDLATGIDGDKEAGEKFSEVRGFTLKPLVTDYVDNSQQKVVVTLINNTGVALTDVLFDLGGSTDFTLAANVGFTDKKVSGKNYKAHDLATGNNYFAIVPANGLAAGAHTATLKIFSDEVQEIDFVINQAVEDPTYSTEVSYLANAYDSSKARITTYANAKKESSYSVIGSDTATPEGITLTQIAANASYNGAAAVADYAAAGGRNDLLFLTNTGNSAITKVTLSEVNANGTAISVDSERRLQFSTNGGASFVAGSTAEYTLPGSGTAMACLAPYNIKDSGEVNTYLMISYRGATTRLTEIKIPVSYVVYKNDLAGLTMTPNTDPQDLGEVAEGSDPKSVVTGKITLTNTNTNSAENTLYNVNASFAPTSTNPDAFSILYDGKVASTATIKSIAPTATADLYVIPAETLPYGDYEATLLISADNLKTAIKKDVKVTITQSQEYVVKALVDPALDAPNTHYNPAETIDASHAQRLYNSLVAIIAANGANADFVGSNGDKVFYISNDAGNDTAANCDITITFTGAAGATTITGATVVRKDTKKISVDKKVLDLSTADTNNVATHTVNGATVKYPHFTTIDFRYYSTVTLCADYNASNDLAEFIVGTKDAFNAIDGVTVVGIETKDKDNNVIGITGASAKAVPVQINDAITVLVPNGKSVASILGNLPTATQVGYSFEGWEPYDVTTSIDTTTPVTQDTKYLVKWHTHNYSASWDETEANASENPNVVWTWTKDDATGKYVDASVTIYCTSANCPDREKSAITYKTKDTTPVITFTGAEQEATCVQGSRYEYTARINPTTSNGSPVFTSKRVTKEDKTTIKGHQYKPTVTWSYNEESKKYEASVLVECQREGCTDSTPGHKVTASSVSVKDDVQTPATCTKEGRATYTIQSFVVEGKTYTPADFAAYTTVEWETAETLPALGHDYELTVDWASDHKSVTAAKLTCKACDETIEEHQVDVIASVTYAPVYTDESKTILSSNTAKVTYKGKDYTSTWTDHEHEWVASWSAWARSDETLKFSWETKLTLTCSKGLEPEYKYPEVTITKTPEGEQYIDYVATATFEGTTYTSETLTVDAKTGEITQKHTDHKWSKDGATWAVDLKSVSFTLKCDKGETKTFVCEQANIKATKSGKDNVKLKATITVDGQKFSDETVVTEAQATAAGYTIASGSESGQSASEPEQAGSWNLFYKDSDINIALPAGIATDSEGNVKGEGKWTGFFKVDGSGKVTVTGKPQDAAKPANSTIVAPIMGTDDEGNDIVVGEFQYSLPVSYAKPSLKLTSTSGSVNSDLNADQTLVTKVTEKKSSTAYEPLEISDDDIKYTGTVTSIEAGDSVGEIKITAKAKSNGKIKVQLENWNEAIELTYNIKAVKKNVLTASAKQVILSTKAVEKEAQNVTVLLNGSEITSADAGVTVDTSKLPSSVVISSGVEEGKVVDSTITFAYAEGSTSKGNGNVVFKDSTGKVKATVKVVVSDVDLNEKAINLKVKSKLNAITGQKMVLEPTFKGIGGPITDVAFDSSEETYEAEWDEERGNIVIGFQDGKTASKGSYEKTLIITSAGETVNAKLKVQVIESKPTVKIDKLTLPLSTFKAGTAEGTAYIKSTYKLGGKTFSLAPKSVTFKDGTAIEGEEGWFTISKANVKAYYNAEDGTIEVKALGNNATKTAAIKVEVSYEGLSKSIGKSLSIKLDKNK